MNDKSMNMNEKYVAAIIDAIKNGRAAVMIGSGFSKNANNGHLMPNWAELAAFLNCNSSKSPTATSDILELAEIYVSAYGRSELDRILLEKTDNKALNVTPSELYVDLLNIPWVDIFTTNYDTLLEDAAKEFRRNIDHEFKEIHSVNDITFSQCSGKTRIIKLHGSFPSHRPFIITEEDYRTYESKFAPFVNTVQQSMLENIFCLIGFSSDDPNFKHWIGWVRDNLGNNQPPIYLITASDISEATQQYLHKKNIHIVNISYLCYKTHKTNKHYDALKRLFAIIHDKIKSRQSSEWKFNLINQNSDNLWNNYYNARKSYPGWIVPPFKYINSIWWQFNLSRPRSIQEFNIKNFMNFYDMIWLMDKATYPLHDYIENIIQFLDSSALLLGNSKELSEQISYLINQEDKKYSSIEDITRSLLEKWEELAIIFLKYLFTTQNETDFQEWIESNGKFIEENEFGRLEDIVEYYKILFLLAEYDDKRAKILLDKWKIKSSNILLQSKQALLYNQLGDYKKCLDLLEVCKNKVDDIKLNDDNFHYITSLKGWVNYYYITFKENAINILSNQSLSEDQRKEQNSKLEDEFANDLNVNRVRDFFRAASQSLCTALSFKHDKEYFTFENNLPIVIKENSFYNGYPSFYFAFCIWSNYGDLLNFAPKIGSVCYDSKNVSNIIKLEIISNGLISSYNFANIIRRANPSLFKNESILFTRTYLSLLTDKQKYNLMQYLSECLSIFINSGFNDDYNGEKINFSFELLGRLCFLLNAEQRKSILELAIRIYLSSKIHFFYYEKFALFFKLTLQSQEVNMLYQNIDALFKLPVIQEHNWDSIELFTSNWIDPFEELSHIMLDDSFVLSNEDAIKYAKLTIDNFNKTHIYISNNNAYTSTSFIIPNAIKEYHGNIYYRYINRLIWIMKYSQDKSLIQKFICNHLTNLSGNISKYGCQPWVILNFVPDFNKYKTQFINNLQKYTLTDIYFSLNYPIEYVKNISFNQEELKQILTKIKEFTIPKKEGAIPFLTSPIPPDGDYISYILLNFFCNYSELLNDSNEWIEKWIESQQSYDKPFYQLELVQLIAGNSTDFGHFIYKLEDALRSDNIADINDSCNALWCWRFIYKGSYKPNEIETILLRAAKDRIDDKSAVLLNRVCEQISRYGLSKKELDILYIVLNKNFTILNDNSLNIAQSETLENILRSKCSFPQRRYYCAKVVYQLIKHANLYNKREILESEIIRKWLELIKFDPFSDTKNIYLLIQTLIKNDETESYNKSCRKSSEIEDFSADCTKNVTCKKIKNGALSRIFCAFMRLYQKLYKSR